jgi:UDP-2,4-diacetamido-2,4,6-trideoxy-beta-L-altropyranose hydrolase
MYNIAIRADGGPETGMGHIMRCLSLAKEFKRAGCTVCFFSKYEEGIRKISSEGFEIIELESYKNFNLMVIDTYNVSEKYFFDLRSQINKLAYLDDINKFDYPVDILINGNITGEYFGYKKYCENEVMLLGPKYNLIRDEFKSIPARVINDEINEIMLTTGGSDPYDLSIKFTNLFSENTNLKDLKLNVIVGSLFKNKSKLRDLSEKNKNIVLHENVKNISEIMLRSDIAISSGGSTLYELCACGTPTLAFVMADNQEFLVEKMAELGFVESLGWYNALAEEYLAKSIKELCNDYDKRKEVSKRMQELVDGEGAGRVVKEILSLLGD